MPSSTTAFARRVATAPPPVTRAVLLYGLLGGLLIALLGAAEYRWLVLERAVPVYAGLIAALFAALGIWLGVSLRRPEVSPPPRAGPAPASPPFVRDEGRLATLGITRRELEVLELIASGLSNRDIAERIYVSENTVKTHTSRVFGKLGARRRTEAVQIAQRLGVLPWAPSNG